MKLRVTEALGPAERATVRDALSAYNRAAIGDMAGPGTPLAVFVEDAEGAVLGGAVAELRMGWLFLDLLHLPAELRGQGFGTGLLDALEAEARARGLLGVHLNTASFQAPGFYERHGYTRIGTLQDLPPGHALHWYAKRFPA
jgi:GNAT superfamily N-acetyltransferase